MSAQTHFAASSAHWQAGRLRAAADEFGKAIIEEFLRKYLQASEQILAAERKEYRKQPSSTLKGQIQYHAHQVSTVRWLLSVNSQRKPSGKSHDDSIGKRREST